MNTDHVDVLIITGIQAELAAVLALRDETASEWMPTRDRSGSVYHVRQFTNERSRRFTIAVAWSGEAGASSIALRTERLIEELDPACLAMCGICVGNRDEVALGDVIVADRIYNYDESQMQVPGKTDTNTSARDMATYDLGMTWRIDASYFASEFNWAEKIASARPSSLASQERWLLHALYDQENNGAPPPISHPERRTRCPDWSTVLKKLWAREYIASTPGALTLTEEGREKVLREQLLYPDGLPTDPPFRVHVGAIATTSRIIKDSELFHRLNQFFRHTLGIEMEAAIIGRFATALGRRAIVVKAVADYGDHEKDDRYRAFACRASAEFLLAFLRNRFEPEERRELSAPTALRHVTLDRITIRNFKNIRHLDISFANLSELPGHWTCIAGLNGAGKSAVLQAIVLALLGDRLAPVIGDEWLKRARRTVDGEPQSAEIRAFVRNGQELTEIALHLGQTGVNQSRLMTEPAYAAMRAFWDVRTTSHLLISYGAGRNLSEHRDTRHLAKSEDVRRQMTLFDPHTQIAGVEFLLDQAESAKHVFPLFKRVFDIVFEDGPLSLEQTADSLRFTIGGAVVAATELPDGFRATIAWLAALCSAWCDKSPEEALNGDPSRVHATVIIDEIDLHLHAALQRVLVPRLRKALPKVQWIVTTHSPLVVSSFDFRELVVLDDSPVGPVMRELDRQILAFSTDEVYRWLMGVPPHSAALDERLEHAEQTHDSTIATLVAQSVDVSQRDAEEDRAWLDELAQRVREREAKAGPDGEST